MSVYKIPCVYKGESLYNGKTAYNAPSVYNHEGEKKSLELLGIYSGMDNWGLDPITYTAISTELVSGVLDSPVYATHPTNNTSQIFTTNSIIINKIKNKEPITLELWFKPSVTYSGGSNGSPVLMLTDGSYWTLGLSYSSSDKRYLIWIKDNNSITVNGELSGWHHFAIVLNGDGFSSKFFIDGIEVHKYTNFYISRVNQIRFPQVYNQRNGFDTIQLCIWDGIKYTENFTPPTKVIPVPT